MNRIRTAISANPLAVDAMIALGLSALSLFALAAGATDLGPAGPLNITLLLLQTMPLVVRRRHPVGVLIVVTGSMAIQTWLLPDGAHLNASPGILVAFFTIGERLERRVSLPLAVSACVVLGVAIVQHTGVAIGPQSLIQTQLFFLASWFVGDATRVRRLYTHSLEEQTRLMALEREERARRVLREERERIARELHDAVTHHVSVMVIQASGALRALDKRPAESRAALEAIGKTGRKALSDMRRMLGILGHPEIVEPAPGLDLLGELLEQIRGAGLAVELSIQGEPRTLDPGIELSAYRIIQEALTNSLKHAGGGRARVTVRYQNESLDISVDDERGTSTRGEVEATHDGVGLIGMRERVAILRGTFTAQPTATGFRVSASLPLDEPVSALT
ncbi:MAG TPA: histidine kinase [Candidatus Limnocylindria bacterium]|nr:histidine kinase [Candidatus Limnocylindria bacterium]